MKIEKAGKTPKKHVLLIYPSAQKNNPGIDDEFAQGWHNIPIGVLSVASYVKEKGYDVTILDFRRYEKKDVFSKLDSAITNNTVCIGFSMMTAQLGHGLQMIDYIKSKHKIPIVAGGVHATLFPKQMIEDDNIDFVLSGEGELSFYELLESFKNKKADLSKIDGLAYKTKKESHVNPPGKPLDVEKLPFPDYDLMGDIEVYIPRTFVNADGSSFPIRCLDIHTSRGCPYQCTFCINTLSYFKKWRTKKTEDILAHIDMIMKKYNLDFIWFMDDFFFGNMTRVKAIANHLIDKKYNIKWEASIRVDLFRENMVNDEILALLKKSGCHSLGMGLESGSDRILKKIKKGITIDQTINAITQCEKYDIMPRGNFICGYPTETKEEVKATGKLILTLKKIHPKGIYYSPGLLRPYPGAELYKECVSLGFEEPKTLREWAGKNFDIGLYVRHKDLKWIKYPRWLMSYQIYLYLASLRLTSKLLNKKQSFPFAFFGEISLFRLEHNIFFLPIEPTLLVFARKAAMKANSIFTSSA